MGIHKVQAEIECDGCGGLFSVDLDTAVDFSDYGTHHAPLNALVADAVNASPWVSFQGEHWLCRVCTSVVGEVLGGDGEATPTPTRAQVAAVLEAAGR